MIEIPEAIVLSRQLNDVIAGKRIKHVIAANSPHKFTWYCGDPSEYGALLRGRTIEAVVPYGGRVEISAEGAVMHLGDGVILRYYETGETLPVKHQLLVEFGDDTALIGTVAMYGGIWAHLAGDMDDNSYYKAAKRAVPVLSGKFDYE